MVLTHTSLRKAKAISKGPKVVDILWLAKSSSSTPEEHRSGMRGRSGRLRHTVAEWRSSLKVSGVDLWLLVSQIFVNIIWTVNFYLVGGSSIFLFSIIYGIILPIDYYFSRWLKPPTSYVGCFGYVEMSWTQTHRPCFEIIRSISSAGSTIVLRHMKPMKHIISHTSTHVRL